jgi:hypothetical protein
VTLSCLTALKSLDLMKKSNSSKKRLRRRGNCSH